MNDTLYHLCRICCDIMDGWRPVPAWVIAEATGVSVSTALRRLRKLKEDGLARVICENAAPDDEMPLPRRGWAITDKTRQTEEFKKAWAEEVEICRDVFGKDMFPEEG